MSIDDQPIEAQIRDRFAREAASAPLSGDLHALADRATRTGRSRRRRTAAAGAALTLAVVVGGVAAVDAVGPRTTTGVVPGASASTSTGPTPSASGSPDPAEHAEPALMFRGVVVPVPAAMLDPDAVRCGTPVTDAAYVDDPALAVNDCLAMPKHPESFTTVVLQPLEAVPAADRKAGGRQLPDGRWQVAGDISQREVWLTVTSPDEQRAVRLFSGALVVAAPLGCAVHPGDVPGPESLTRGRELTTVADAGWARVCGYRAGWLTGAGVAHTFHNPAAALNGAPPPTSTAGCNGIAEDTPPGTGWWVEFKDGTRMWVDATRDCPLVYDEHGGAARVTSELVSDLWAVASGPASMSGLAGTGK